jgi:ligand-binding sensor domain-containing protein
MFKLLLLSIVALLFFTGCEEEPPVLPGLKFSSITVVSSPPGAVVYFNNKSTGKVTPTVIEGLEPGFYKIDLKLDKYIDTTLYTLVARDQQDTMDLEMKENPTDWWYNWNSSNSPLPVNVINDIALDAFDNKWLGTNGKGLVKFDGQTWTVFDRSNSGIPDNYVLDVFIEKNNRIWVATTEGFGRFENGTWVVYNMNNSNLPDNYITSIDIDLLGNVWLSTYSSGVVKFDGVTFKVYNTGNSGLPVNRVNCVKADQNGSILCGTHGGGIAFYTPSTDGWINYNTVTSNILSEYVNKIVMDQKNEFWVGYLPSGGPSGVSLFNRKHFTHFNSLNSPFTGTIITGIAVSTTGNVWIASADAGIFHYNGSKWSKYNTANSGIKDNVALSIAIDRDGNKWVGAGGLNRYIGGKAY